MSGYRFKRVYSPLSSLLSSQWIEHVFCESESRFADESRLALVEGV